MKKAFDFKIGRSFCCLCAKYCKVIKESKKEFSNCCKADCLITYCPLTKEQRKEKIINTWQYE